MRQRPDGGMATEDRGGAGVVKPLSWAPPDGPERARQTRRATSGSIRADRAAGRQLRAQSVTADVCDAGVTLQLEDALIPES